jgi:hypothetical protein
MADPEGANCDCNHHVTDDGQTLVYVCPYHKEAGKQLCTVCNEMRLWPSECDGCGALVCNTCYWSSGYAGRWHYCSLHCKAEHKSKGREWLKEM